MKVSAGRMLGERLIDKQGNLRPRQAPLITSPSRGSERESIPVEVLVIHGRAHLTGPSTRPNTEPVRSICQLELIGALDAMMTLRHWENGTWALDPE
ncbi:hypothetical protein JGU66_08060 [Myxococcaceae bacterium JPH2]|nr:hypothetical protein [Myxococcaceae bacterium JPH2]